MKDGSTFREEGVILLSRRKFKGDAYAVMDVRAAMLLRLTKWLWSGVLGEPWRSLGKAFGGASSLSIIRTNSNNDNDADDDDACACACACVCFFVFDTIGLHPAFT